MLVLVHSGVVGFGSWVWCSRFSARVLDGFDGVFR